MANKGLNFLDQGSRIHQEILNEISLNLTSKNNLQTSKKNKGKNEMFHDFNSFLEKTLCNHK